LKPVNKDINYLPLDQELAGNALSDTDTKIPTVKNSSKISAMAGISALPAPPRLNGDSLICPARVQPPTRQSPNDRFFTRLGRAQDIFQTLIDETPAKPRLERGEQWVINLLDAMKKENLITQRGCEYVHTAEHQTGDIETSLNALSGDVVLNAQRAKTYLKNESVVILGIHGRKPVDLQRQRQLDAATHIVLVKGDLHAVAQLLETFAYLRSNHFKQRSAQHQAKTLVIPEADFRFYRPLFEGLFGAVPLDQRHDPDAFYQAQCRRCVSHFAKVCVHIPTDWVDVSFDEHAVLDSLSVCQPDATQQPISCLFIATTKQEKVEDWRLGLRHISQHVHSLNEVIDKLGEPKERLKTYVANACGLADNAQNSGKARAFVQVIQEVLQNAHDEVSREDFLERLRAFGVNAGDHLHFVADDRGFEIHDWPTLEPFFDADIRKHVGDELQRQVGGQGCGRNPITFEPLDASSRKCCTSHQQAKYPSYDRRMCSHLGRYEPDHWRRYAEKLFWWYHF
jgi:hypothetical protein